MCGETYIVTSAARLCPQPEGKLAYCQPHWEEVTDRDILIAIYERICKMPDLSELQSTISSLTSALADMQPVIQANTDLSLTVISKLEELAATIASLEPTQAAIDALKVSAAAALASVQSDKAAVVAVNQAYTDELNKLSPAPAPPAPPTTPDPAAA